jgi:hypothetical protein
MNDWCICWFSHIFLLGILIFKELTARRLYKSFGVEELIGRKSQTVTNKTAVSPGTVLTSKLQCPPTCSALNVDVILTWISGLAWINKVALNY